LYFVWVFNDKRVVGVFVRFLVRRFWDECTMKAKNKATRNSCGPAQRTARIMTGPNAKKQSHSKFVRPGAAQMLDECTA
jgi:hypothetical protein